MWRLIFSQSQRREKWGSNLRLLNLLPSSCCWQHVNPRRISPRPKKKFSFANVLTMMACQKLACALSIIRPLSNVCGKFPPKTSCQELCGTSNSASVPMKSTRPGYGFALMGQTDYRSSSRPVKTGRAASHNLTNCTSTVSLTVPTTNN